MPMGAYLRISTTVSPLRPANDQPGAFCGSPIFLVNALRFTAASWARRTTLTARPISSSGAVRYGRPSPLLCHPRWVNGKHLHGPLTLTCPVDETSLRPPSPRHHPLPPQAATTSPLTLQTHPQELAKLVGLEPAAREVNVTRNYLEWLTQVHPLPFPPSSSNTNTQPRSHRVNTPPKTTP
jgi:hypothetical protein